MSKVLVVIIDGMDRLQVARFEKELPALRQLKEQGSQLTSSSVCPPDSPTACASLYTGLNPARHGVVYFIDPLEKTGFLATEEADNSTIRGRTFWDLAGQSGKRVCVLLPYLGYPVWPVNGIMVGKSTITTNVQILPESSATEYPLPALTSVKGFPGHGARLDRYIEAHKRLVSRELELARQMWAKESWDLFAVYSGCLDTIHHYFWKYSDEEDPSYPGPNRYHDVLRDFYKLYDAFIGELMALAGADTSVLVASDHGHGRRPVKLLNVNELLRQKGLLASRARAGAGGGSLLLAERLKRSALSFVSKHDLGNLARLLLKVFPGAKRLYTSPPAIDWDRTLAYVSDLSGIKAYSHGGIKIARQNLAGRDYEELRDSVIEDISGIVEPASGQKLVKWIRRREDLYSGEYINRYPDIILELEEDWGVGWAVHNSLFGASASHNLVPGSHKSQSPVLFVRDARGRTVGQREATLMDIAPTVLDLLQVEVKADFDGRSLFQKGRPDRGD